ncbi:MAG TPA: NifU family protein [Polyangia bacterium]
MTGGPETEDPRQHAARIEELLGETRASMGPVAWRRVDELVSRLTALYGAALGRTLALVEEAGALDGTLRARLCGDDLVGALLALHGMHPDPPLERARAGVDRVLAVIGEGAGTVELVLDGGHGILAVTLAGSWRCAMPRAAVDAALTRAIEEAAPELTASEIGGVEFGGAAASSAAASVSSSSPAASNLVQLDVTRSRARPAAP